MSETEIITPEIITPRVVYPYLRGMQYMTLYQTARLQREGCVPLGPRHCLTPATFPQSVLAAVCPDVRVALPVPDREPILLPHVPMHQIQSQRVVDEQGRVLALSLQLPPLLTRANQMLSAFQNQERLTRPYDWDEEIRQLANDCALMIFETLKDRAMKVPFKPGFSAHAVCYHGGRDALSLRPDEIAISMRFAERIWRETPREPREADLMARLRKLAPQITDLNGMPVAVARFPIASDRGIQMMTLRLIAGDEEEHLESAGRFIAINPWSLKVDMQGDNDGDPIFAHLPVEAIEQGQLPIRRDLPLLPLEYMVYPDPLDEKVKHRSASAENYLRARLTLQGCRAAAEEETAERAAGRDLPRWEESDGKRVMIAPVHPTGLEAKTREKGVVPDLRLSSQRIELIEQAARKGLVAVWTLFFSWHSARLLRMHGVPSKEAYARGHRGLTWWMENSMDGRKLEKISAVPLPVFEVVDGMTRADCLLPILKLRRFGQMMYKEDDRKLFEESLNLMEEVASLCNHNLRAQVAQSPVYAALVLCRDDRGEEFKQLLKLLHDSLLAHEGKTSHDLLDLILDDLEGVHLLSRPPGTGPRYR
jgi:hypothetical protein